MGLGGFTTQDLVRCRLMARMVALVYGLTLFVRLAKPHNHFEAICTLAARRRHANATRAHAPDHHQPSCQAGAIRAVLTSLAGFS